MTGAGHRDADNGGKPVQTELPATEAAPPAASPVATDTAAEIAPTVRTGGDGPPMPLADGATISIGEDAERSLILQDRNGARHPGVVPVRSFPVDAPDEFISLVDSDGRELASIEHLDQLPPATRAAIEEALAKREFMPIIERIVSVSRFVAPCVWSVTTSRGATEFLLRGEEAIRRLPPTRVLIADGDGIQYLIADLDRLDERSRRILDRFM